jgi:hypothetical protein
MGVIALSLSGSSTLHFIHMSYNIREPIFMDYCSIKNYSNIYMHQLDIILGHDYLKCSFIKLSIPEALQYLNLLLLHL